MDKYILKLNQEECSLLIDVFERYLYDYHSQEELERDYVSQINFLNTLKKLSNNSINEINLTYDEISTLEYVLDTYVNDFNHDSDRSDYDEHLKLLDKIEQVEQQTRKANISKSTKKRN